MNEKDYYENTNLWTIEKYLSNPMELERFEAAASLIPDGVNSVLDIGCGNGAFLKYIEMTKRRIRIISGFERSSAAIANKVCEANILKGSSDHICLPEFSFDLVFALEVIEHLPKYIFEDTLTELERIASHFIIISVPFCEKGRQIECNYCGCKFSPHFHMREFSKASLKFLFKNFQPLTFKFIHGYKYYFLWEFLKKARYKVNSKVEPLPPNIECPQCGNRGPDIDITALNLDISKPSLSIKQFLKRISPYRRDYRWLACLYERKEV